MKTLLLIFALAATTIAMPSQDAIAQSKISKKNKKRAKKKRKRRAKRGGVAKRKAYRGQCPTGSDADNESAKWLKRKKQK